MSVRLHMGVLLLLLSLMLTGCPESKRTNDPTASIEAEDTSGIYLYELPDRWNAAADAVIASGEGRTCALIATMEPECEGDSILSPCSSALRPDAEQPALADQPPVARSPFVLPEGYQAVNASRYAFAVPEDWHVEEQPLGDEFVFQVNGEPVGETQILGWFDEDTWRDFKPNHSEQTDFVKRDDLLAEPRGDVHLYRIQLIHTKPAAEQDPDWTYEETRWYVADKASERAYGFYFGSETVNERVMEAIVSSFRLNETGDAG